MAASGERAISAPKPIAANIFTIVDPPNRFHSQGRQNVRSGATCLWAPLRILRCLEAVVQGLPQPMYMPPFTCSSCPVMNRLSLHFSRGWRIGVQNQLNLFCDQRVTLI